MPRGAQGMREVLGALLQVGLLAREGLLTNLWGLGCPVHCRESSLSSWLLAFLLGFILATLLCFALWLSFLCPTPIVPRPAGLAAREAAIQLRQRLGGYRHLLDE